MYLGATKEIKVKLLSLLAVLIIAISQSVFAITDTQLQNYRIRIHTTTSNATIRVDNGYSIYIDGVKVEYTVDSKKEDFILSKVGNNISLKNSSKVLGQGKIIKLKKNDSNTRYFEVKGIDNLDYAKYPDNAIIQLDSKNTNILVINETSLENYLKGVIPYEMGANAPLEAMKAQAITARTLAVRRVDKNAADGYDITNTTSDQVYKGYSDIYFSSTNNVYKAVEQTKGLVLSYNGNLIEGMYYSNNGGYTANDGFVWSSGNSTPYYKSKKDDYDTYLHKTTASWGMINYQNTYTKDELRKKILDGFSSYPAYYKAPYCTPAFTGISENFDIEVLSQENGYITQMRIKDDGGHEYIVKNYANRWFFGLRSQQYNLEKLSGLYIKNSNATTSKDNIYIKNADGNTKEVETGQLIIKGSDKTTKVEAIKYLFSGRGYGHGIGMSQNGAMNRAEAGQSYKEILSFYYDGTKVVSNYGN